MTFYSTVLIKGKPIGWTAIQAKDLNYAKRTAGYHENTWMREGREKAIAIEEKGRLKLLCTTRYGSVDWIDRLLDDITFEKNVLGFDKNFK